MVKYIAEESFKSTDVSTVLWTWVQWNLYSGDTLGTIGKCPLNGGWAGLCQQLTKKKIFFFYSALESAAVIHISSN